MVEAMGSSEHLEEEKDGSKERAKRELDHRAVVHDIITPIGTKRRSISKAPTWVRVGFGSRNEGGSDTDE